jgi:hypothetical protein
VPTTNIGPCGCCGGTPVCSACENQLPRRLYVTFTGGDCRCLLTGSSYEVTWSTLYGAWRYTEDPSCDEFDGFDTGSTPPRAPGLVIAVVCVGGAFVLGVSWSSSEGEPPCDLGGGFTGYTCELGSGGSVLSSCDPLDVTFSSFSLDGCNRNPSCDPPDPPCDTVPTSAVLTA